MERFIKCINDDGFEVRFDCTFSPFMLEDVDGLYEVKNTVATSENTMTDGATYQGSVTKMRNIVLTLRDNAEGDHQANRMLLYSLFKSKSTGTLTYFENEGAESRSIDYEVESVAIESTGRARKATVSLLCPDPFFMAPSDIMVAMAGWEAGFEFAHEFKAGGEELGYRVEEKLKSIDNDSAVDGIGMTIYVKASGAVINPTVYHVEQGESITIGTDKKPLNLSAGDVVVITTGTNDKHVYLESGGSRTEINEYLSEDSTFLQLNTGINTIGYSASSGESYVTIELSYRYKYPGV